MQLTDAKFRDYAAYDQDGYAEAVAHYEDNHIVSGFTMDGTTLNPGTVFMNGWHLTFEDTFDASAATEGQYVYITMSSTLGNSVVGALVTEYTEGSVSASIEIASATGGGMPLYQLVGTEFVLVSNGRIDSINNLKADLTNNLTIEGKDILVGDPTTGDTGSIEDVLSNLDDKVNILTSVDLSDYSTTEQSDAKYLYRDGDTATGDYNFTAGVLNADEIHTTAFNMTTVDRVTFGGGIDTNASIHTNGNGIDSEGGNIISNGGSISAGGGNVQGKNIVLSASDSTIYNSTGSRIVFNQGLLSKSTSPFISRGSSLYSSHSVIQAQYPDGSILAQYITNNTVSPWQSTLAMYDSAGNITNGMQFRNNNSTYDYGPSKHLSYEATRLAGNVEILEYVDSLEARILTLEALVAEVRGVELSPTPASNLKADMEERLAVQEAADEAARSDNV